VAAALANGCTNSDDDPTAVVVSPVIEIHAFPSALTPRSEATLAVVVRGACAAEGATCTLCLALVPPTGDNDPGVLYAPSAVSSTGTLLSFSPLPTASEREPFVAAYRAPNARGAHVITASLFLQSIQCTIATDASATSAGTMSSPVATTTVRIDVDTPAPPADGSASPTDGSAGSVDAGLDSGAARDASGD
jgi:hypothetical protein